MSDFWSRRKSAVAAEETQEAAAREQALIAERDANLEDQTDEEILKDLGLPDPDTLGEGDNFQSFLSEAVPARIRTRALRRLWRVNPIFANLDGLVDYGEDYTDAALVVENMQTVYQVGKGMLARFEEEPDEQADEGREEPSAATDDPEDQPIEDDALLAEMEPSAPDQVAAYAPAPETLDLDMSEPQQPGLRRMRFTFQEVEV